MADTPEAMRHRRSLLLSRTGPEAYKVIVDHFRPDPVTDHIYAEVKDVLRRYYQKDVHTLAERVVFGQCYRKEGEMITTTSMLSGRSQVIATSPPPWLSGCVTS